MTEKDIDLIYNNFTFIGDKDIDSFNLDEIYKKVFYDINSNTLSSSVERRKLMDYSHSKFREKVKIIGVDNYEKHTIIVQENKSIIEGNRVTK